MTGRDEIRQLIADWMSYSSVEGNSYDEGFEAGLCEAANQLSSLLEQQGLRVPRA